MKVIFEGDIADILIGITEFLNQEHRNDLMTVIVQVQEKVIQP